MSTIKMWVAKFKCGRINDLCEDNWKLQLQWNRQKTGWYYVGGKSSKISEAVGILEERVWTILHKEEALSKMGNGIAFTESQTKENC